MTDRKNKIKKSVRLSPWELALLKAHAQTFDTILDFADEYGIGRVTIKRIVDMGSGREDMITRVKEKLSTITIKA